MTDLLLANADRAARLLSIDLPSRRSTLTQLAHLAGAAGPAHASAAWPSHLSQALFQRFGLQRETQSTDARWNLLPIVLSERRGNCLGIAALYLSIAELRGYPLEGVLVPGHFFVRDAITGRNVEPLKQGQPMTDEWYKRRYQPPPSHSLYLRRLKTHEALMVFHYNLANELRLRGDLYTALSLYRQVTRVLPDFAEAQANLGLTLQLLGRKSAARRAYLAAAAANPQLEHVRDNLFTLGL